VTTRSRPCICTTIQQALRKSQHTLVIAAGILAEVWRVYGPENTTDVVPPYSDPAGLSCTVVTHLAAPTCMKCPGELLRAWFERCLAVCSVSKVATTKRQCICT
jgi:hypothetical protein